MLRRWCVVGVLVAAAVVAADRDHARLLDPASRKTNKVFVGGSGAGSNNNGGGGGAALVFAEGLRQLLERHLLGVCDPPAQSPPGIKMEGGRRSGAGGNWTVSGIACAPEDPRELPAKLAELSLRASMLSRSRVCDNHLSVSLAHALSDLARKSSRAPPLRTSKGTTSSAEAAGASEKKRKLSKSQKNKLQAKQKTALAVKKKAAAVAAAAALNSKLRSELQA